jgi:predicted sugar kinase
MTIRISAPTRLHFGLLHVPTPDFTHDAAGRPISPFGGLGAMLAAPRIETVVQPSKVFQFQGSLAARARSIVERFRWPQPVMVTADGPAEHTGLGVGTAFGLSIARVHQLMTGVPAADAPTLMYHAGRGERSRIGAAGFHSGGYLVDPGHGEGLWPERRDWPGDWHWLLVKAKGDAKWHGEREHAAFQNNADVERKRRVYEAMTDAMDDLQTALTHRDYGSFSSSLGEYNRLAGEHFDHVGSEPYAAILEFIRKIGHTGCGQSSWGPTLFALCETHDSAVALAAHVHSAFPDLETPIITTVDTRGAIVSCESATAPSRWPHPR